MTERGHWLGVVVVMAALCLALPGPSRAEEPGDDGGGLGGDHYVIKVTPALAYIDAGTADVVPGQNFVVVRDHEGLYVPVARVRVVRVADSFSIAEILDVAAGEDVEVLQRVVAVEAWEQVAAEFAGHSRPDAARGRGGARYVVLLAGLDARKGIALTHANDLLVAVDDVDGGAIGVRLGRTFGRHARAAITYRVSGKPLSSDGDVTQLSMELDLQLLHRGAGRAAPYLGIGAGMHHLDWESPVDVGAPAYKFSAHAAAGVDVRLDDRWGLMVEAGYQRVLKWDQMIDASAVRLYAGLSQSF